MIRLLGLLAGTAVLAGCQQPASTTRFVFDYPPAQAAAFRQAREACTVEQLKVASPLLARRQEELATEMGNRALVACMAGKGFAVVRTQRI
jgi:uncharacterized lipoprotein YajG